MKSSKRIATGLPPDIAYVSFDRYAKTYNVIVRIDRKDTIFAAIDKDHANDLAKQINDCAWVTQS